MPKPAPSTRLAPDTLQAGATSLLLISFPCGNGTRPHENYLWWSVVGGPSTMITLKTILFGPLPAFDQRMGAFNGERAYITGSGAKIVQTKARYPLWNVRIVK